MGEKGYKLQQAQAWALRGRTNEQIDRIPVAVTERITQLKRACGLSWRQLGYRCQGKAIGRAYLLRVAHKLQDPILRDLARSDLLWDEIVSIEPDGEDLTYDLVIPGTHNFVANDLVVHNSGEIEQTADVVIFLYREDYYEEPEELEEEEEEEEKEEEREEEERRSSISTTEVIIGKQRNGPLGSFKLSFHRSYASFYESFPEKSPF